MAFNWGVTSLKRSTGVYNPLFECATRSLGKCKKYDQSVQWRGGVRTAEQQNEIYKTGASTRDGFIKKSYHQEAKALDVAPVGISMDDLDLMVKGKLAPHSGFLEFAKYMFETWQEMLISGEAKGTLYWGGHWDGRFRDLPHWEVRGI